jgi:site-specific recombinase
VTLSTGGLTLALCAGGFSAHGVGAAACGIVVIGLLNFGVSFVLALGVAVRARGVEHAGLRLLGAVFGRLVRSPGEFFFPPAS